MALSPISTADDWSSEIYSAASELFDGELRIVKPGKPGTFDPIADAFTGGTPDVVIQDWRPARAQHMNAPLEHNDGNGWSTKRSFLFQCELRDDDPYIHKGLVAQFRGGKDPSLTGLAFQIASALNSSHAALRTVRASTEG